MKELQLGFISDEEMADWCNKDIANYKKHRSRWSKTVLKKFAEYELVKGGVKILKIYDPIFNPSLRQEVGKTWRDCWGYDGNDLDTNIDCWRKLKPQLTHSTNNDKTGAGYVSYWKCEGYGVANKKKRREGRFGYCHYVFCVIVNGKPQEFSDADQEEKARLEEQYLNPTYKEQKYEMRALYADYKRGELTQEEYEASLNDIVEMDLGWKKFEETFDNYLKAIYGETAYSDFRQKLEDRAYEIIPQIENKEFEKFINNSVKEGKFEF